MLNNQARFLKLDVPDEPEDDDDSDDSEDEGRPENYGISERVRTQAGMAARHAYVQTFF